jgi:hypothetical protein
MDEPVDLAWLFMEVERGNVAMLEDALRRGFQPTQHFWHGESIVEGAARAGIATLRRVVALLGTADIPDEIDGYSALINMVITEHYAGAQACLNVGSSVEFTGKNGANVLHAALYGSSAPRFGELLAPHVTIHALLRKDDFGETPFSLAANSPVSPHAGAMLGYFTRRYVELGGDLEVPADDHGCALPLLLRECGRGDLLKLIDQSVG